MKTNTDVNLAKRQPKFIIQGFKNVLHQRLTSLITLWKSHVVFSSVKQPRKERAERMDLSA
jgi:hypothetical protein